MWYYIITRSLFPNILSDSFQYNESEIILS